MSVLTGGAVPWAAVVSSWIVGTIDGLSNGRSFSEALHQGGREACATAWTATAAFGLGQLIGPVGQNLFQKSFNKVAAGASVLADKITTGINSVLNTSLNIQDVYNFVNGMVGGGGGMAGNVSVRGFTGHSLPRFGRGAPGCICSDQYACPPKRKRKWEWPDVRSPVREVSGVG